MTQQVKGLPTVQKIRETLDEIKDARENDASTTFIEDALARQIRLLEWALTWDWEAICVYAMEGWSYAQQQYVTIIALCADGNVPGSVTQEWIDADKAALAERQ